MVSIKVLLDVLSTQPGNHLSRLSSSRTEYGQHALNGANALQHQFYNSSNGLWTGYNATCDCSVPFWWNSAVTVTTLADLTSFIPSAFVITGPIFSNTFKRAQASQLQERKISATERCIWPLTSTCADAQPAVEIPRGFINGYYDDEGWWALAWLKVYDITNEEVYLRSAAHIFNDMLSTGYNGTCGAMYWDRKQTYQNAIANELFLAVAAGLANRVRNKSYYLYWALKQWQWFKRSGMINVDYLINDGLTQYCINNGGITWSYNQGVILGALVELNFANFRREYLDYATNIALAAINELSNDKGILTEAGGGGEDPDMGFDEPQFKGIFIRNLQILQRATRNEEFAHFIQRNADSVWSCDRSSVNGTFGNVWDRYYGQDLPQGHSSALAAIVAAVGVTSSPVLSEQTDFGMLSQWNSDDNSQKSCPW
jgi:predicted alpha-1,6-mannanase (GH76 family)